MKFGAFTFVLHSHLPYCRNAGRWPHGEEWLHEAASETYIPLLDALYDLKQEGCSFKLTTGITPVLVEQLSDSLVIDNLVEFIEDKIRRAQVDVERFDKAGEGHLHSLAKFYLDWYQKTLTSFNERFDRNIVSAFNDAHDGTNSGLRGVLDIIAEKMKAEGVARYVRDVFDREVAPNSWEDKVEIIRQFIRSCGRYLSSLIRPDQPERYAQDFQELIRAYVEGLQRTSSMFRKL